ncbi:NAD(P)/FAD-dependent oxidoreductase [Brucellaceae bacterium D45D]
MSRHVAIIGAGAVGIVCALELLRGGYKVTVIEPGRSGGKQAASYGNAGWLSTHSILPPAVPGVWKKVPFYIVDPLGPLAIHRPYLPKAMPWLLRYLRSGWTWERVEKTARILRPLLAEAPQLHKALATEAGVPHLIAEGGVLCAYTDRAHFEKEALAWGIRARAGIEWRELSGAALRDEEPVLPERYRFAVCVDEAGRCRDPGAYVAALATLAVSKGAIFKTAYARDFHFESDRLAAVVTNHGEVACDEAIIAAGIHSAALASRLGDKLPLESERGYHATVEGASSGLDSAFMASDASMVVQQMECGLRAAGQVEIAGIEAPPDWRRAEILKQHLAGLFPSLDMDKARVWMGHRPSMPDGRPCIGFSRRSRHVAYAFGHGHVGLMASARTGRIVAALFSARKPQIDIEGFAPARFG